MKMISWGRCGVIPKSFSALEFTRPDHHPRITSERDYFLAFLHCLGADVTSQCIG